jgi:23S rRNA (pseudouridine1915-N3)-methyltransferase
MKVKLLCIGKTEKKFLVEGENEYEKRLQKYISFEKIEINDIKNAKNFSEEQLKVKEGELILGKVQSTDFLVLLDERGKMYSSLKFADFLQHCFLRGNKNLIFVVGGPYGFSKAVYDRANEKLSLSSMTLSHQMIRLFFIEQIYRGMTILKNEPYHHE